MIITSQALAIIYVVSVAISYFVSITALLEMNLTICGKREISSFDRGFVIFIVVISFIPLFNIFNTYAAIDMILKMRNERVGKSL